MELVLILYNCVLIILTVCINSCIEKLLETKVEAHKKWFS